MSKSSISWTCFNEIFNISDMRLGLFRRSDEIMSWTASIFTEWTKKIVPLIDLHLQCKIYFFENCNPIVQAHIRSHKKSVRQGYEHTFINGQTSDLPWRYLIMLWYSKLSVFNISVDTLFLKCYCETMVWLWNFELTLLIFTKSVQGN